MGLPLILFWILLFLGRDEMGFKGIAISIFFWFAMLLGTLYTSGNAPYFFIMGIVIIDVILILKIFGGDIKIN